MLMQLYPYPLALMGVYSLVAVGIIELNYGIWKQELSYVSLMDIEMM